MSRFTTGCLVARFAVQSADTFAQKIGYPRSPLDDLLVFHMVFGKTVPDISLNAVANLGYADCRFLKAVYPGDTLNAVSEVIGLKENSNKKTGIVYVRSRGFDETGETVLDYARWVMVRKRDETVARSGRKNARAAQERGGSAAWRPAARISIRRPMTTCWPEARIVSAITRSAKKSITSTASRSRRPSTMIATRLYQNTARIHFNQFAESKGRFGRRLIYGGHAISLARALTFNGLGNAFHVAAINGGRHVAPLFAGCTVFAWSEVLGRAELPGREDVGALRLRTIATKDRPCADFPLQERRRIRPRRDP